MSNNKERASKTFLVISLSLVNEADGEIGALERFQRSDFDPHFLTLLFFWSEKDKEI